MEDDYLRFRNIVVFLNENIVPCTFVWDSTKKNKQMW